MTPEAREYLCRRCITNEVIDRRKIGMGVHCGKKWITIPIADAKGAAMQMVLRKPTNRGYAKLRYRIVAV